MGARFWLSPEEHEALTAVTVTFSNKAKAALAAPLNEIRDDNSPAASGSGQASKLWIACDEWTAPVVLQGSVAETQRSS